MFLYWARCPASNSRNSWRTAVRSSRRSSMRLPMRTESGATICTRKVPGNWREPRQDGRHQIGAGLPRHLGVRAKFVFDERVNPRFIDQLEPEAVRAEARHFFEPATGLSGNGDQRHVISS